MNPPMPIERVCEQCGYDLAGDGEGGLRDCPECGAPTSLYLTGLSKRYWQVQDVRRGALLILWAIPATALVYLFNVAVEGWLRGAGAASSDALAVFRPTSAMIFVPAMLLLAGAWMLASPVSDDRYGRRVRGGLRWVCIVAAVALCLLVGQRIVARSSGNMTATTPWLVSTLHLRQWAGWGLLALGPVFGFLLMSTGASVARVAGYERVAYYWRASAAVVGVLVTLMIAADLVADWLWNTQPVYKLVSGVGGPGGIQSLPISKSPGVYDPERFYFVWAILCAVIGLWGSGIWLALMWLRARLERVPRPTEDRG